LINKTTSKEKEAKELPMKKALDRQDDVEREKSEGASNEENSRGVVMEPLGEAEGRSSCNEVSKRER